MIRKSRALILACSMVVMLLAMTLPAAAASQAYQYIGQWGSQGSGAGQFEALSGIAVDVTGDIYVVDSANNRISKFSPGGSVIDEWSVSSPYSIAVNTTGDVYVGRFDSDSISRYRPGEVTPDLTVGQFGTEDAEFNGIFGLAVNASGDVYVADQDNDRIQKFDADLQYLGQWGTLGETEDGKFNGPGGVAVDGTGDVYVSDTYNHRIQKFTPDGAHILTWGSQGQAAGEFDMPEAIAVDETGDVYVADTDNRRIQKFDPAGQYIVSWGGCLTNSGGVCTSAGNGQFDYPVGIAITSAGRVYVADSFLDVLASERVQYFEPTSTGSTITKSMTTNTVKYKSSLTVTGTLRDSQGRAIPNVPVVLKRKNANGSWTTIGPRVYTNNSGAYTATIKPGVNVTGADAPGKNNWYSAWFIGANGFSVKASSPFYVYVSPIVTMSLSRTHIYKGQTLRIAGYIAPNHAGRKAYLQEYQASTGKWVYLEESSHVMTSYSSGTSLYVDKTYVDFRDRFSLKIRIATGRDSDHAAGASAGKWIYFNK